MPFLCLGKSGLTAWRVVWFGVLLQVFSPGFARHSYAT